MKLKFFILAFFMTLSSTSFAQDWPLISQILTMQDIYPDELSQACKEVLSKYAYTTNRSVSYNGNEKQIFCYHKSNDSFVKISLSNEDNCSWNVRDKVFVQLDDAYAVDNLALSIPNEEFSKDYYLSNNYWYYTFKPTKGRMSEYRNFYGETRKEMSGNKYNYIVYASIKW